MGTTQTARRLCIRWGSWWRIPLRVLLPVLLLWSCTVAQIQSPQSPGSSASTFVARNDTNAPLVPGQERVDFALTQRADKPLVMLAISGGGSRSAYYAARVMEELARMPSPDGDGTMLDSVRVISGVSAGSLAAAWYVLHYDERYQPDFFERYKATMATNLQWRTYGHMALFPPLALQLVASSITRTDLLANEIEKLLGAGCVTFNDLRAREWRPQDPTPILLVNGTLYNSGQRLVMTNLPAQRFPSLFDTGGLNVTSSEREAATINQLVQPLAFEDFGSDIGSFRLAQSIAASAAFPIILAPVSLNVYPQNVPPHLQGRAAPELLASEQLYVADGGVYENEGVDALLSLLKTVPRKQPVLMIIIDSSQRVPVIAAEKNKIWDPISIIWRMYDIGSMRPLAFYGAVASRFHDPEKFEAVMIRMEGYDKSSQQRLGKIPTSFKISSADKGALDTAAVANVQQMSEPLYEAYSRLLPKRVSARR